MMYPGMSPVNVDNAEKLSTVKQLPTAQLLSFKREQHGANV